MPECPGSGGCEDPAGVGQDVGEEEVGVDLVSQAPHLPARKKYILKIKP